MDMLRWRYIINAVATVDYPLFSKLINANYLINEFNTCAINFQVSDQATVRYRMIEG